MTQLCSQRNRVSQYLPESEPRLQPPGSFNAPCLTFELLSLEGVIESLVTANRPPLFVSQFEAEKLTVVSLGSGNFEIRFSDVSLIPRRTFETRRLPNDPEDLVQSLQYPRVELKVHRHIDALVQSAVLPKRWIKEDVAAPTKDCRGHCVEIAVSIFDRYGMIPFRCVASKTGGVLLEYRIGTSDTTLSVEVDNELDAVAVLSNGKTVLASGVFEGEEADRFMANALESEAEPSFSSR